MKEANRLELAIVYEDSDLIEVGIRVVYYDWSAYSTAYGSYNCLSTFTSQLSVFSTSLTNPVEFEMGRDDGIGYLSLRFYPLDTLGHLACLVQLSTNAEQRPEPVARLSLELRTEPAALDVFGSQLQHLAKTHTGKAVLALFKHSTLVNYGELDTNI